MVHTAIFVGSTHTGGAVAIFGLSFLALCPLAVLLGDLTENLAGWCGPTLGGLINATLGNATEAIVLVQALRHHLVKVEQAALLGGVLSNMLLVLGLSFLVGGGQKFDKQTVSGEIGVLAIAGVAIVLPSLASSAGGGASRLTLEDSRTSAVVLLAMYGCLLVYTLGPKAEPEVKKGDAEEGVPLISRRTSSGVVGESPRSTEWGGGGGAKPKPGEEAEEEEQPSMSLFAIFGVLGSITYLMAVLANQLVEYIFPLAHALKISSNVISCIFLPVIGNASELATSVIAARNGHMDLALGVALGSSCQISLFLLPVAVLFGWSIGVPFSLDFESIFAAAFLLSVIVGSIALMDGRSNWLKGMMLLGMYVVFIAALVFGNPAEAAGPQPAPAPSTAPGPASAR